MHTETIQVLGSHRCELGESPLWHPQEQALYAVDIARRHILRWRDGATEPECWSVASEPSCLALRAQGGLVVARRDGLWSFDAATGRSECMQPPPFDPARQRYNDGKVDAVGRLWVGTIDDARRPDAHLYRLNPGGAQAMAAGITTSNGLAWSPDAQHLYWADTKAHAIYRLPYDLATGAIGDRQVWAQFAARDSSQPLKTYGGRPDGAAVDAEGAYWVAMFEGQRLLRLSPAGTVLAEIQLPVRCPTMPCFGGADLRTLYITTAREGRSAEELKSQPWAGALLMLRVTVPGMPVVPARI
ncbi:SMP-30/gluconolactonase/LRE family protein [Inhella gelatinilytica]|uniref:SMP-30/gluconolactonase/LRE family protein n=1 Tax=Inhella gelatinilytica TaxID=2795030 RepID=A0A931IS14_9BURK|nr:SMP-30/gluconolactonase/LRE family protein [Inhella gelatinilytica]MBH9551620.1 SMP-30/gluconolactonase/LRE family protein [Inhella gelatinilytica]